MNINLGAPYEAKLKKIIERGYAGNQTEVIRQAINELERKLDAEEAMLVERGVLSELQKMEGKKWLSHNEVMKKAGL